MDTTCPPTPSADEILSEPDTDIQKTIENNLPVLDPITNECHRRLPDPANNITSVSGIVNHAYSTDTLYNQLPITNSTKTLDSPKQKHLTNENWRNMRSILRELMKNTRYIFIIISCLFEGVLIKGKYFIAFEKQKTKKNLFRICTIYYKIL
jgi:hypothetical protein